VPATGGAEWNGFEGVTPPDCGVLRVLPPVKILKFCMQLREFWRIYGSLKPSASTTTVSTDTV
jgi:hypothetical protein